MVNGTYKMKSVAIIFCFAASVTNIFLIIDSNNVGREYICKRK